MIQDSSDTLNYPALKQMLEPVLGELETPDEPFQFYELCGFLYGICCSPDMITPSEWLPFVLGEDLSIPENIQEPQAVIDLLMALYNWINAQIYEGDPALPPDLVVSENIISNFGKTAALGQWSRGFYTAHEWLSEIWGEMLPANMEDELGAALIPLSFFFDRHFADDIYDEAEEGVRGTFQQMANTMAEILPFAIKDYAALGRSLGELYEQREEKELLVAEGKVGRNEPCPCGSGKKYKQCCLH